MITTDIARDPWASLKDLALGVGIEACWSSPIHSGHGEVLGTLALYPRRRSSPAPIHLALIQLATRVARGAIEQDSDRQRESNERAVADRYGMVLKATKEIVWEWDLKSDQVQWNHGLPSLGYEAPVLEPSTEWLGRIHSEDEDRVRDHIRDAVDSGSANWEAEYRFRKRDGTYGDVFGRGLIVRDGTGNPVRMLGSLKDISRQKRQQLETERLIDRFRLATSAAAVGTWRFDLKTEHVLLDASLNHLLGGEEVETVRRFSETMRVIHPEDRERVKDAIDESISTGQLYQSDHRIVLADGEVRWLHSRGRVLCDAEGRPEVMTGAVADITEVKHAEQSMAMLATASRLLAESLDVDQTLASMTRMAVPSFADAAVVILKHPPMGKPRIAVAHAIDPDFLAAFRELQRTDSFRVQAPGRRVLQTGRSELHSRWTPEWFVAQELDENVEVIARRFHVSSSIHVPIMSAGSPFALMVFLATGTRVYNERDLAFAEELARRASNAMHNAQLFATANGERERAEEAATLRERLVAIVGHDLRTPLSAISMAAHLLSQRALAQRDTKLVHQIERSANRMTRMIAQILDFARIRAGMGFDLDVHSVNIHRVCEAVVDEVRLGALDRTIEVDIEGRGEAIVDGDRLAEVLSNIINNAIQHGRPGPVTVRIRDTARDAITIAVHNFGRPIPEEQQTAIFDPFRRDGSTGARRSHSIGLGLFISREIVRAHGGSITLRSPDRAGTTFTVVLPRNPVHADDRKVPPPNT